LTTSWIDKAQRVSRGQLGQQLCRDREHSGTVAGERKSAWCSRLSQLIFVATNVQNLRTWDQRSGTDFRTRQIKQESTGPSRLLCGAAQGLGYLSEVCRDSYSAVDARTVHSRAEHCTRPVMGNFRRWWTGDHHQDMPVVRMTPQQIVGVAMQESLRFIDADHLFRSRSHIPSHRLSREVIECVIQTIHDQPEGRKDMALTAHQRRQTKSSQLTLECADIERPKSNIVRQIHRAGSKLRMAVGDLGHEPICRADTALQDSIQLCAQRL
jgi:hypothetical protein